MKNVYLKIIVSIILFLAIRPFLDSANSNDIKAFANSFILIEDFDERLNGNIHNQGEWVANEPGAAAGSIVIASPPPYFSGKALQNDPRDTLSRGNAYLALGANEIGSNGVGTLFLQVSLQNQNESNFSIGLTPSATPNIYSSTGIEDFAVEVNFGREGLRVRNGSTYTAASNITLQDHTLYHVWIVVDSASNSYELWIDDGIMPQPIQATIGAENVFAFREPTSEPLRAFSIQNVGLNNGISYIDNVSIAPTAEALENPVSHFRMVDNFEILSLGTLNNNNGWQSTGNVTILTDPESTGNKVISLQGNNATAYKAVNAQIDNGNKGTVYFRMMRQQTIDAFAGLSDDADPVEWSAFETQIGVNNLDPNKFGVRNGEGFSISDGEFRSNTWYCTWLVADNISDSYEVYIFGGQFEAITRLQADQLSIFGFRNGQSNSSLRTFYVRTGTDQDGIFYLDDIYIDAYNQNLSSPASSCQNQDILEPTVTPISTQTPVVTLTPNPGPTLDPNQPLDDPIPHRIETDGSTVQFQTIATVPQSAAGEIVPRTNPRTRLNFLYHSRDGSGRLFANDLRGQLYVINPEDGQVDLYLNIKPYFSNWLESPGLNSGFSTFTFHPAFAQNGLFYTIHTEDPNGIADYQTFNSQPIVSHGVLIEWRADDPSANQFSGTHRELLRIAQASTAHGMQQAQFNPNAALGDVDYGLLYVSNGDGENSPHFSDAAQNLGSLQGTIFRIDPLGKNSPNGKYGIPETNPFVNSDNNTALKEIYAYGFRNPNRFTWDTEGSKKMLLANIGQNNIDEVELIEPTRNYGWNIREGTFRFDVNNPNEVYPLPSNDADNGFTYPVAQYDHDEGYAIQGGFVYRGSLMPEMQGVYIFGDIVLGHLFYVNVNDLVLGTQAQIRKLTLLNDNGNVVDFKQMVDLSNQRADLRFGLDEQGEIYIMSKQDGEIRKLVAGDIADSAPTSTPIAATHTPSSTPSFTPSFTPISTSTPVPSNTFPPITSTLTNTPTQTPTTSSQSTTQPSVTVAVTRPSATSISLTPTPSAMATFTPTYTPTPLQAQPASIEGKIWCDRDDNDTIGVGEGISSAKLQLIGPDSLIFNVSTDTSGNYRFAELESGIYTLRIIHVPNFCNDSKREPDKTIDKLTTIDLLSTQRVADADFVFQPTAQTLADVVWHDSNNDGAQNDDEEGISDVIVELYDASNNALFQKTSTNNYGEYIIEDLLSSAEYYMVFSVPSGWQISTEGNSFTRIGINVETGKTDIFSFDSDITMMRFAISAILPHEQSDTSHNIYLPALFLFK